MFKSVLYFILLFAYLIGTVAGIGICLWSKNWIPALCVVVLAIMAFPTAKEYFKYMKGKD